MQTFMPFDNVLDSASCLDYRRLGKQRVECKQILLALGADVGNHVGSLESHWRKHPAVRMWKGHELVLAEYAIAVCVEWKKRGFNDTLLSQFEETAARIFAYARYGNRKWENRWNPGKSPNWIGYDAFHASHRSNLLRKDRAWYSQFGWQEPADLEYVWPVEKEVAA